MSPPDEIPMAGTFSTTPHLHTTITGNGAANPDQFYEETSLYNGVRAADLSKLCFLPILNNTNKQKLSKLAQNVLLRGHHNRIYHYNLSSRLPQKMHYHSVELPLDWLLYYDAISRVSRDPTELYGFK